MSGFGAFATALATTGARALVAAREGQRQGEETAFRRFVEQRALQRQQQQDALATEDRTRRRTLEDAELAGRGVHWGKPPAGAPVDPVTGAPRPPRYRALAPNLYVDTTETPEAKALEKARQENEAAVRLWNKTHPNQPLSLTDLAGLSPGGAQNVIREAVTPRAWAPTTQEEAVDFSTRKARGVAGARAEFRAPPAPPRPRAPRDREAEREAYVLRRIPQLMRPSKDPAKPWVARPGLSRDEAVAAAQAEYAAVAGTSSSSGSAVPGTPAARLARPTTGRGQPGPIQAIVQQRTMYDAAAKELRARGQDPTVVLGPRP